MKTNKKIFTTQPTKLFKKYQLYKNEKIVKVMKLNN